MDKFITKKIPRRLVPRIRRLQAKRMLRLQRRVSEAEIIVDAIGELEKKEKTSSRVTTKVKTLDAITDFYKSKGHKVDYSKNVDEIVYGGVDEK